MQPADNSLEDVWTPEGSSLEAPSGSGSSQSASSQLRHITPTRLRGMAFGLTGVAIVLIIVTGIGAALFSSHKDVANDGAQPASNYAVSSIPVDGLKAGQSLEVGSADHLTINGKLRVSNTVVLDPGVAPTSPTAGQIYYDKATNAPYYFNGSQFISLAPTAAPQSVTSLGGVSGPISVGNGLQVTGGQLALSNAVTQALANSGGSGVRSLQSGSASLAVSQDGNGNYTLSSSAVVGSGGVNQIALFTGGSTLGGSILSQSGSSIITNGNLNVTGAITSSSGLLSNSLQQTAPGQNVSLSAGNDTLTFTAGGRNFTFPTSGLASQTICTTSGNCAAGGGQSILLQPGAAQLDVGAGSSIFVNNSGGGNLLQLQGAGSDRFVVTNSGDTTIGGNLVAQGGTLTAGTGAQQGSLLLNAGNGNSGSLKAISTLGQNTTYTLPDPGSANATICLSSGNCVVGGSAGGDLTGSYPNPTLAKIQGTTVNIAGLAAGQILQYNGASFVNQTISGDITLNSSGVATIGAGKVTNTNLVNNSLTVTAGTGLSGGGSVALGGTTSLTVQYGSAIGTAVQGNTSLTCASGTGPNLAGGGNIITLGSGGSCNNISISNSPTFSGSLSVTGAGGVAIGVAGTTTGSLVLANASNSHFTTIQGIAPAGQDQVITVPASSAASDTVCLLTLANCVGTGGSVSTTAGTQNFITKYNNAGGTQITNSQLFDNGTSVGIATAVPNASFKLDVNGNTNVNGSLVTANGLTVSGGGIAVNAGGVSVNAGGVTVSAGGANITGNSSITGTVTLNGNTSISGVNTFSVGSGATTLGGTLGVTGLTTLSGGATITGINSITGNTTINTTGTANTTIGNASGSFALTSTGLNVTTAGNVTGGTFNGASITSTSFNTATLSGGTLSGGSFTGGSVSGGSLNATAVNGLNVSSSAIDTAAAGALSIGAANATLTIGNTANPLTLQGNASSVITATGGGFTTTVGFAGAPTASQTYNFDRTAAAGTYTVCTTAGNCVGAGGSVSTSGGTQNFITKYNNAGANQLGNSQLFDNGTNVNVGSTLGTGGLFNVGATNQFQVASNGNVTAGTINGATITATTFNTATISGGTLSGGTLSGGTFTGGSVSGGSLSATVVNGLNVAAGIITTPTIAGTLTLSSLTAGVLHTNGSGVVSTSAVLLGTETSGNYVSALGSVTGLTLGGTNGVAGAVPTLSVNYGSGANTAVQGNTTLTCASGTGNLSGGGNSVTLGAGGSCNNLTIANSPSFSGTLSVTGAGGATIGVAGTTAGVLNLANATNTNIGSLQSAVLGQATTYTLPDPGQATASICLSTGNCAGAGGGITGSGTSGKFTKFNGPGSVTDSSNISESGTVVTNSGSLVIQSATGLTLGTATGNTGSIAFQNSTNANKVTLQSGASASNFSLTLPTTGGSNGDCLQSLGGGVLSFTACTGGAGGGVTSLDSQTGVLSLANSTGSAGTITIDNASTTVKGIAQFNATNFSAAAGVINTIQDIATTSSPTFATVNGTTGINTGAAAGTQRIDASGNLVNIGTVTTSGAINGATISGGTLSGGTISGGTLTATAVNGLNVSSTAIDAAVAGALSIGSANATLTIGSTGKLLTLQGNASSAFTATGGGFTTTFGFSGSPTASQTYNLDRTAAAGTYTICTTAGNCVGAGGSVSTTGGTQNFITKYNNASGTQIANSQLFDNGTNVNIGSVLGTGGLFNVGATNQFQVASNGNVTAGTYNTATISGGTLTTTAVNSLNVSGTAISGTGALTVDASGANTISLGATSTGDILFGGGLGSTGCTVTNASGNFACTGTINTATISGGTLSGGSVSGGALSATAVNGLSVSAGTITNPTITGTVTGTSSPTITGFGTINGSTLSGGTLSGGTFSGGSVSAGTISGGTLTGTAVNGLNVSSSAIDTAIAGALSIGASNATLTIGNSTKLLTLQGNASSVITATGGGFTTTVGFAGAPTASQTYNFDRTAAAGTYSICTTAGNCVGTGGAVSTSGGTQNFITKYTNAAGTQLGNSLIFDDGTFVGLNTTTNNGELSIAASGTQTGLYVKGATSGTSTVAVVNAATGFTGSILDLQLNGVSKLSVNQSGNLSAGTINGATIAATTFNTATISGGTLSGGTFTGGSVSAGSVSGGTITGGTLSATAVNSLNVSGTAISGTGALTFDANGVNTISIGGISTGDVLLAGGVGSTGCTITNASGNLACSGTVNTATISGGSLTASAVNGLSVAAGTITNPTIAGTVTGTSSPTITGFGTYNGQTISSTASFTGTLMVAGNTIISNLTGSGTRAVCANGSNVLTSCGANAAGVTLQQAYDSSTNPEIVVDATRGALTVRDAASALGANLLEVQNNAGTVTYLAVTATGTSVTGTLSATGNINTTGQYQVGGVQVSSANLSNDSNLAKLNGTGPQTFTGNNKFTGSGNGTTSYGALFENTTDSTTGFQVQTAAGTNVLNIDTVNSITSLRGTNSSATLGAEKVTNGGFTGNATGWILGTGWAYNANNVTKTAGTASDLEQNVSAVAGETYKVTFSISGWTAGCLTPEIGGVGGVTVCNNSDQEQVITATGSGNFKLKASSTFAGTVDDVSVQKITFKNSILNLQDSIGRTRLEVRVDGFASDNTFIGLNSGRAHSNGASNTGLGVSALQNVSDGFFNNAVGAYSLQNTTYGARNNALGTNALNKNTIGSFNVGIGDGALTNSVTGDNNVAVGTYSFLSNTTGSNNTGLGTRSGYTSVSANANTTGSNNTFLGYNSGPGTATQLQNATAIGTYSVVSQNDSLVLGCINTVNGCTANTKVGIGTATPSSALNIATGTLLIQGSYDAGTNASLEIQKGANTAQDFIRLQNNNGIQAIIGNNGTLVLGTSATTSRLGLAGTGVSNGITFNDNNGGPGVSSNLYAASNNVLKTDDSLIVGTIGSGGTNLLCYDATNKLSTCSAAPGAGSYIYNGTGLQATANFNIQATDSGVTGTVGGIIRGAASGQTADLLQLQNSSGTVLAKFDAAGVLGGANGSGANIAGSALTIAGGQGTGTGVGGNILFRIAKPGSTGAALNALSTVASLNGTTGAALFQNASDSTTAFQIQNAAGTNILSVDSTNSITSVRGINSTATLGSELATGVACTGTNWTGTGPWTHSTGSAVDLSCTPPASVTAGAYYQVTFTVTGRTAGTITPVIGSNSGTPIGANVAGQKQVIFAAITTNPVFTPSTDFNGSVSAISIKLITTTNPVLKILDASGNTGPEIRSGDAFDDNLFFGRNAGLTNGGIENIVVGTNSFLGNLTGSFNNVLGAYALARNTTGSSNNVVGEGALSSNISGNDNTAIGQSALGSNTIGSNNIGLGSGTGRTSVFANANTTGSNNTFLGYDSGPGTATQLQNATSIGTYSVVSQNDSLVLGCLSGVNGCTASTKVGIGTATPGNRLSVNALTTADSLAQVAIGTGATTNKGLVIQGVASQSADLLQIQRSDGTIPAKFDSNGTLFIGANSIYGDGGVNALAIDSPNASVRIGNLGDNRQIKIGGYSGGGFIPSIQFGSSLSAELYSPAANTLQTNNTLVLGGNTLANAASTATTGTTSGTGGSNVTTIVLAAAGSFANNDVIFVDNTGGSGQDYYTRIVSGGGTTTLTISPAVSYGTTAGYTGNATITKYTAQYIGSNGVNFAAGATRNQNSFFQGYFTGGVVVGTGSTTLSDGNIQSTGSLTLTGTSVTVKNTSDSTTAFQVQNAAGATALNVNTSNTANLVANGNLETSINGWTAKGAATLSADTTQFNFGKQSLKTATTAAANDGASYAYAFKNTTQYTLSLYARLSTGSMSTFVVGHKDDGAAADTDCLTGQTLSNSTWTRFTCTFTSGTLGINNGAGSIYIKQSDATVRNIYIDGVQLEEAATASTFNNQNLQVQVESSPTSNLIVLGGQNSGELSSFTTSPNTLSGNQANASGVTAANGYVYVVGGNNGGIAGGTSAVRYAKLNADGSTGTWTISATPLPAARSLLTSVTANGYIYAIGGADTAATQTTTYYAKLNADGSTGAWQTNANALPQALDAHASFTSGGYVYVLGGYNGTSTTYSTVYYAKLNADGSTGAWQTNANALPAVRCALSSSVANGYVYAIGGDDDCTAAGGYQASLYYARINQDGSIGAWTTSSTGAPVGILSHTSAVANGYLYVLGGASSGFIRNITSYAKLNADGSIGAWTTNSSIFSNSGAGRLNHGTVTANGYLYVIGGNNGSAATNNVFYASTQRLQVGGALDLVGLAGGTLTDYSGGGELTAGNTNIIGGLQVQGATSLAQSLSVGGNITATGTIQSLDPSLGFRATAGNIGSTTYFAGNSFGADRFTIKSDANDSNTTHIGGTNPSLAFDANINTFKSFGNNANAFQIQNTSSANIFNVDTTISTNMITIGDLEGGINGNWLAKGSSTVSRVTTQQWQGNVSLQVATTTAASDGAKYAVGTAINTQYTLSLYAKVASGTITDVAIGRQDTGSDIDCLTGQTLTTNWTRFSCTFTTGGAIASSNVYIKKTGAAAETFFIDGIQLQTGASVTAFNAGGALQLSGIVNSPIAFQNKSDSSTAFQIQNATSDTLFTADTTNSRISVGTAGTAVGQLYVSGTVPTTATGSVATATNPKSAFVQGRYTYVVNETSGTMKIFDVSNPASPVLMSTLATGSVPRSIYVQGRYAYVANYGSNTLTIYDVSNPVSPVLSGSVATGTQPFAVYVQGRYAYVANDGSNTLTIYDVSNPVSPVLSGSVATGAAPRYLYVQGRYAYVTNNGSNTLTIYDVSNPMAPVQTGSVTTGAAPTSVYVQGRYAYVTNYTSNTMTIYDVSNPAAPALTGTVTTGFVPNSVYVQGRYAYVANINSNTMTIYDVSNPAAPALTNTVTTGSNPWFVSVQGRYAFVLNYSSNTMQIFDIGGAYVQQLETGGIETGTLRVSNNTSIGGDAAIQGGLSVSASAQILGNFATNGSVKFQAATNSTAALAVQDSTGNSLLSVNTADGYVLNNGTRSLGNELDNPGFEAGGTIAQSGYQGANGSVAQSTITTDSTNARSGNRFVAINANSTNIGIGPNKWFAVSPGDELYFEAYVKNTAGTNGTSQLFFEFGDKDKSTLTYVLSGGSINGSVPSYTLDKMRTTVPAGKYYVRAYVSPRSDSTTGTWHYDDLYFKRVTEQAPIVFKNSANTTAAFQIQDAAGAQLFTGNTLTRTAGVAGNSLKVGDSTGTDTALTVLQLDASTADPATNLASLNGGLFYNSTTNKVSIVENGVVKVLCNKTDLICGAGATTTLQNTYDASAGAAPSILTNTTFKAVTIQTATGGTGIVSGNELFGVRASNAGDTIGNSILTVNSTGIGINIGGTGNPATTGDLSFGQGANRTINVIAQATAATAGNNLTVSAGTGNTSGAGGQLILNGGTGGSSGIGGGITLQGGTGGGGGGATAGGAVTIAGGTSAGSGVGGSLTLQGGAPGGANGSVSGAVTLKTQNGTSNNAGGSLAGAISITGGNGGAGSGANAFGGAGSTIAIRAGDAGAGGTGAGGAGAAGDITIQAGKGAFGSGSSSAAGTVTLTGGTGTAVLSGGAVILQGGAADATSAGGAGGAIALNGANGTAFGTGGIGGNVTLTAGNAGGSGINNGGTITLKGGSATSTGIAGGVLIKNTADSATAFQVQNAAGTALLKVDTITLAVATHTLNVTSGLTVSSLADPGTSPTVTPQGTTGAASYSYLFVARNANGSEAPSFFGSTNTGNATLTGGNFNRITWSAVAGAKDYAVYRAGVTGGSPSTLGLIGTTTNLTFDDTGLAASGTVPVANLTGAVGIGTTAPTALVHIVGPNTVNGGAIKGATVLKVVGGGGGAGGAGTGGDGGDISLQAGQGGGSSGAGGGISGNGGVLILTGGAGGGASAGSATPGIGGKVTITGGVGGTDGSFGSAGGGVTIQGGAPGTGSTTYGTISVNATGGLIGLGTASPNTSAKVTICALTNCTLPATAATALVVASDTGLVGGSSIRAHGTITGGLADFGEYIPVEGAISNYDQGDVLVASTQTSETATKSSGSYQTSLIGIVTTTAGLIAGGGDDSITYDANGQVSNRVIIALAGRVPVKVSLENGPIATGDYLTSSSTPGVAMKAIRAGNVIGKALENYDGTSGTGKVLVFVHSGYADPTDGQARSLQGDVSISGTLNVSGLATFADLNVSGTATITNLQVQTVTVSGNLTVQGLAHVQDLQIDGHIITAGGQPLGNALTAAGLSANVTITGSDTTGTITITTGSAPTAGDLTKIIFSKTYGASPHIVLSPSNDAASGLRYFKGATSLTDFILNAKDIPAANTTYQFDYFIAQ